METDIRYSPWGDFLNKFQIAPEWIQALILILLALSFVAFLWTIRGIVRDIFLHPNAPNIPPGDLLYTIHRSEKDDILIYNHADQRIEKNQYELLLPKMPNNTETMEENSTTKEKLPTQEE